MTPVRHFARDHRLAEVGPRGQHRVDDVARDQQRRVRHLLRRDDRDPLGVDVLLVERTDAERLRHREHLRLDVVGDQLDRLPGLLSQRGSLLTMLLRQRARVGLRALRPRRLRRLRRLLLTSAPNGAAADKCARDLGLERAERDDERLWESSLKAWQNPGYGWTAGWVDRCRAEERSIMEKTDVPIIRGRLT